VTAWIIPGRKRLPKLKEPSRFTSGSIIAYVSPNKKSVSDPKLRESFLLDDALELTEESVSSAIALSVLLSDSPTNFLVLVSLRCLSEGRFLGELPFAEPWLGVTPSFQTTSVGLDLVLGPAGSVAPPDGCGPDAVSLSFLDPPGVAAEFRFCCSCCWLRPPGPASFLGGACF
jgi:hypothetical protein